MAKIDLAKAQQIKGTSYPPPYDQPCQARVRQRLGAAGGLTAFGVNRLVLSPGTWSSQRHWHSHEDEFVFVVEGEVVLVTDDGEETLAAGDSAAFKAGVANGHHLVNRSGRDAVLLEVGNNVPEQDRCVYPDCDMVAEPGEDHYRRRDGTSYAKVER